MKELSDAGGVPSDLVSVRVFLSTIEDYDRFNRVYAQKFEGVGGIPPARTAIAVRDLPFGALIEVDGIAVVKKQN